MSATVEVLQTVTYEQSERKDNFMKDIAGGIYPTMITPYKNGGIDYDAVRRLVDWYVENNCSGIFAVCQSSEMWYLSLKEKIKLAETVVKQADGRIHVVASGHCGNSVEEQAEEITEVSKTGIDGFILVSNRFDLHGDGDDEWIRNAEQVLDRATFDIPLGIYECPVPYKRLLTPKIFDWCKKDGRFQFIKDTCCDPDMLAERLEILKDSGMMLFNANSQTLLYSLKKGANGFSGIMANFHPDLLAWLYNNYEKEPEKAEQLSNVLSMVAFTESMAYPCMAKYYLNLEGIEMDCFSRSCDSKRFTEYQRYVVGQMYDLTKELRQFYR